MAISHEDLLATLTRHFPNGEIKITALAADDDHWSVEIRHASFAGKPRIAQHQAVQKAVEGLNIHALQIKTTH